MDPNSGTQGSAPSGSPAGTSGNSGGNTTRSFVAQRSAQIMERQAAQQSAAGNEPGAADAGQQQQQDAPAEQKIKVGDGEYSAQELSDVLARDAERRVRENTRPKSEADFKAINSQDFQLPEGVKFSFNEQDPLLAQFRKVAVARGLDQETFSALLDLHVASQVGALQNQSRLRETNMAQLGAAGPQRIDAVATWLNARAGKDGAQVANFLKAYPSAPIVRAMENIIRQFSNQGGADFSQSHRETQEAEAGKIPGYDQMSFTQRRVAQMAQMLNKPGGYRGGGSRGER